MDANTTQPDRKGNTEAQKPKEFISFSLVAGADDEAQALNICVQALELLCKDDSAAKERIVVYLGSRYGGGQ